MFGKWRWVKKFSDEGRNMIVVFIYKYRFRHNIGACRRAQRNVMSQDYIDPMLSYCISSVTFMQHGRCTSIPEAC